MSQSYRARLLWVTNLAAPYRLPVWERLAQECNLRVGLLEHSSRLIRDTGANRGADWAAVPSVNYSTTEYSSARVARGEDRHYFLKSLAAVRDLAGADAVLLGGWDSPAYWQLLAQAKIMHKATIGFYESTLASQGRSSGPLANARSHFFRSLDRIVVPGPAAGEAIEAMGVDPSRILTGFNAVDVQSFADARRDESHSGHRFLYVGQLIARKNVDLVLEAFAAVATPEDTLTLVGRGEMRGQLELRAETLGVADRVHFIGYLPYADLPAEIARHDTLVLASQVEVWGLVVNEALAVGLQAVVTENCGVARSVRGMPGVYVGEAAELEALMRRAKMEHQGPVDSPPILQNTPEAFGDVFLEALEQVTKAHVD